MTDEPFFFEAQIQLIRRGLPLLFPVARRVSLAAWECDMSTRSPIWAADRLTFRHLASDGDPVGVLIDRLAPHLGAWLDRRPDPTEGTTSFELVSRIVGDTAFHYAKYVEANVQLNLADFDVGSEIARRLLWQTAERLIERMFTGQVTR